MLPQKTKTESGTSFDNRFKNGMVNLKNGLSKQKGKPGRPQAEEPRNERIVLRVTESELAQIRASSLAEGKTVSRYLREVALRGGSVDLSVFTRLSRVLGPIGSNLNQAVKLFHVSGYPDDVEKQWGTLVAAVRKIQEEIDALQGRLK